MSAAHLVPSVERVRELAATLKATCEELASAKAIVDKASSVASITHKHASTVLDACAASSPTALDNLRAEMREAVAADDYVKVKALCPTIVLAKVASERAHEAVASRLGLPVYDAAAVELARARAEHEVRDSTNDLTACGLCKDVLDATVFVAGNYATGVLEEPKTHGGKSQLVSYIRKTYVVTNNTSDGIPVVDICKAAGLKRDEFKHTRRMLTAAFGEDALFFKVVLGRGKGNNNLVHLCLKPKGVSPPPATAHAPPCEQVAPAQGRKHPAVKRARERKQRAPKRARY